MTHWRWFALPLAIWLAVCAAVAADDELFLLEDDPGSIDAVPISDAPGATTVITARQIEASGAANIFDLLRTVPGVDVRYTPMGGHISIRSTGSSPFTEQVLLLIDGTPYNSFDKGGFPGHPNFNGFYPLDRIERIEVIKGPISVAYGANAFAGVIHIISKEAGDALKDRVEGQAYGAKLRVGENNVAERMFRFDWLARGWEATLELESNDGDIPIELSGDTRHSRESAYLSLQRGNFRATLMRRTSEVGAFPSLGVQTQPSKHDVDVVTAHYQQSVGKFVMNIHGSLLRYQGTTCSTCHNPEGEAPDDALTDNIGAEREVDTTANVSMRMDRSLGRNNEISFGVEASLARVERDVVRLPDAPEQLGGAGFFFQNQFRTKGDRLRVISGIRFDYAEEVRGQEAISPRVAVVWQPSDRTRLRGSVARAFRAPTWNERFVRQRFLPQELAPGLILTFQGSPDLERERNDAIALGLDHEFSDAVSLSVDLYRNKFRHYILRAPSEFVPGSPNEARVYYINRQDDFSIPGGEVTVRARVSPTLNVTAGFAYRDVDLDPADGTTAYSSRWRGMLNVDWRPSKRWNLNLAASHVGEYVGSLHFLDPQPPEPGYELVDVAVRYRGGGGQRFSWTVGVIGRNVLDAQPFETFFDDETDTRLLGRTMVLETGFEF